MRAHASKRGTQKAPITNWSQGVPEPTGFHDCAVVWSVATPPARTWRTAEERESVFLGSVDVRGVVLETLDQVPHGSRHKAAHTFP